MNEKIYEISDDWLEDDPLYNKTLIIEDEPEIKKVEETKMITLDIVLIIICAILFLIIFDGSLIAYTEHIFKEN